MGVDVVVVVGRGLTLEDVAVVDVEHAVVAHLGAEAFDVGSDAAHAARSGTVVDEVVGEVVTVDIGGLDDGEAHFIVLRTAGVRGEEQREEEKRTEERFHLRR